LADAPVFDWTCQQLQESTSLDRLESRGTVRIALKSAGLDATSVLPGQMRVVLEKLMPGELAARGIENAKAVCARLAEGVVEIDSGAMAESPDEVFRRLGGA
jgi:hypothetical protein